MSDDQGPDLDLLDADPDVPDGAPVDAFSRLHWRRGPHRYDDVMPMRPGSRLCPGCITGQLHRVRSSGVVRLLCERCGACWLPLTDRALRMNPAVCPGCESRGRCVPYRPATGADRHRN